LNAISHHLRKILENPTAVLPRMKHAVVKEKAEKRGTPWTARIRHSGTV